jgi:hypothetical protein
VLSRSIPCWYPNAVGYKCIAVGASRAWMHQFVGGNWRVGWNLYVTEVTRVLRSHLACTNRTLDFVWLPLGSCVSDAGCRSLGWLFNSQRLTATITEINRIQLVLSGTHNRTFGPYIAAINKEWFGHLSRSPSEAACLLRCRRMSRVGSSLCTEPYVPKP